MYFTDRGIEELETRRGDEEIAVVWLAERMRDFVNLNPNFETAVDRLATYLARDDSEDLLSRTYCGLLPSHPACPVTHRTRFPSCPACRARQPPNSMAPSILPGVRNVPRQRTRWRHPCASPTPTVAIHLDFGEMRYIVVGRAAYGATEGWRDGAVER
ncbi:MAG TPA: DUF6104 family protein [Streptosporangiaceae bacterium]